MLPLLAASVPPSASAAPLAWFGSTALLTGGSLLVALGTDDLTAAVELCGGLTGIPLAYVIPPLCALVLSVSKVTQPPTSTLSSAAGLAAAHTSPETGDDEQAAWSALADWRWLHAPWRSALHIVMLAGGLLISAVIICRGLNLM